MWALFAATASGMDAVAARTFYMGFQDFSYDKTKQAAEDTYAFLRTNADIVCLQFGEDCPWQAAYEGKTWPQELLNKMKRRKNGVGNASSCSSSRVSLPWCLGLRLSPPGRGKAFPSGRR